MFDLIIIGAGPAGITAAIYALRSGIKEVLILEAISYGGQLINTPSIENYPSFENISGFDLAKKFYDQAISHGAKIKFEKVTRIELCKNKKKIQTSSNKYECKTLIIANGANHKKLGCKGEKEFSGKGVSYCATCDGMFYKNKKVIVLGGGNTALEYALFLSNICEKVYLVHRRKIFRAQEYFLNLAKEKENIEFIFDSTIEEISGENKVQNAILINLKTHEKKNLNIDGIFIAIGLQPDNAIFSGILHLDDKGYIDSDENCCTNVPGIYVAGDTRKKSVRQIVTACSDGAIAAVHASNFLNTIS